MAFEYLSEGSLTGQVERRSLLEIRLGEEGEACGRCGPGNGRTPPSKRGGTGQVALKLMTSIERLLRKLAMRRTLGGKAAISTYDMHFSPLRPFDLTTSV